MRLILFAFFLSLLNASTIKNYSINEKENEVEIILNLDSNFEEKIIKESNFDFSFLKLKNTAFELGKITKQTSLIKQIEIFKKDLDVYITLVDKKIKNFNIQAKSEDKNLRIIISSPPSITSNLINNSNLEDSIQNIKNEALVDSKNQNISSWRYMMVIFILLLLIIALLFIKKRMKKGGPFPYFKQPSLNITQTMQIDSKNKILILESQNTKYMLFVGENNSFIMDKIPNQKDIEAKITKMIQSNQANKLSYFLKVYEDEAKKHT